MRINWKDNTLFKFLIVGVFNTLVGCGTMFLLYNLALGILCRKLYCRRNRELFPEQVFHLRE